MLSPGSEVELAEAVAAAAGAGQPLEIKGGGTRLALQRPVQAAQTLSVAGLCGITRYEPGALTLVARAGTALAEIDAALAGEGQRLAFEPPDHRALLGSTGAPTLGGVVAAGLAGPRQVQCGGCRDALLGLRFVTGSGTVISNGGRVMKNVTGYDLVKLLCGSFGTLGVLSEICVKTDPLPERELTLVWRDLSEADGIAALAAALATPFGVTGAAHLPAELAESGGAQTLIRLEGLTDQAAYRASRLTAALAGFGVPETLEGDVQASAWAAIRDVAPFAGRAGAVWQLALRPGTAAEAVAELRAAGAVAALYDLGGGRVWLLVPESAEAMAGPVRAAAASRGGNARLVRASAPLRAAYAAPSPDAPALARIAAGLRAKFDPAGILNPGRMGA
ncbi:MAG: FAD-binding protein [Pikeienuella sp.]